MTRVLNDPVTLIAPLSETRPRGGLAAFLSTTWHHAIAAIRAPFRTSVVFFDRLETMIDRVVAAAELLHRMAGDFPNTDTSLQLIRATEREARRLVNTIVSQLDHAFLTPFDRQDIHRLASELDGIVGVIAALARRVGMYHVTSIEPQFIAQTGVLVGVTGTVRQMVFRLRHTRQIANLGEDLNRIQLDKRLSDGNHHAAISLLLDGKHDPLETLKWKGLYDYIDRAIGDCCGVADTLARLVLKGA